MFLGEFAHQIDGKGRLTIPAKFRGELAYGLVLTRGIDRCLVVYPLVQWRALAEKISGLPQSNENARLLARLVFSGATDCVPDGQGRVLIPAYLRQYAELDQDVVVIGLNDYLEVWGPAAWEKTRERTEREASTLAKELADLGI